jgi:hypothetical protein
MKKQCLTFQEVNEEMKKAVDDLTQVSTQYRPECAEVKAAMKRRAVTLKALFNFRPNQKRFDKACKDARKDLNELPPYYHSKS